MARIIQKGQWRWGLSLSNLCFRAICPDPVDKAFPASNGFPPGTRAVDDRLTKLTVDIVGAYVANNSIASSGLSGLITQVHAALEGLIRGPVIEEPAAPKPSPAVPVKKSVTPDFIISLEDGKKYKSLKRHLTVAYGMTPEEYRNKWGLPSDYPMVAPNYTRRRSELAKKMGLGLRQGLRKGKS